MSLLLRLLFLILALTFLISIIDPGMVMHYVKAASPLMLIWLVILNIIKICLAGLRWKLVNHDLSGQLSGYDYFRFSMIGAAFNLIMPGALGGDIARTAAAMNKLKKNRADNLVAIVADRALGFFSIVLLGSVGLLLAVDIPDKFMLYRFFGTLISGCLLALVLVSRSSFLVLMEKRMANMGRAGNQVLYLIQGWQRMLEHAYQNSRRMLAAFLVCIPLHLLAVLSGYIVASNLNLPVSYIDVGVVFSLVWVVTAIPVSISGLGVRELSLIYLFSLFGVEAEQATAVSVYLYIVALITGFIGLLFIMEGRDA